MKNLIYGLNIQLFAADNGGSGGSSGTPPATDTVFTQSDIDRAVSQAISTRETNLREQFEAERESAVQAAIQEQQRLARLSEDERNAEAQRIAADKFAADQAELARRELVLDVKGLLVEENLPLTVLETVIGQDIDSTKENIKIFKDLVATQVQIELEKVITKPGSPSVGGAGTSHTKETIMQIKDPQERQKAIAENIDLFS